MARKTKEAFIWIINLLRKYRIPFRISGGFAVNIYGSARPLADIDIEVPDDKVFVLQKDVEKYIVYGPKQYKDNEWDLLLMTLRYKNQEIDIFGVDSWKMHDKVIEKWISPKNDLFNATKKKVYDHIVPVISLKDLIDYKRKICTPVDLQDIKALSK